MTKRSANKRVKVVTNRRKRKDICQRKHIFLYMEKTEFSRGCTVDIRNVIWFMHDGAPALMSF